MVSHLQKNLRLCYLGQGTSWCNRSLRTDAAEEVIIIGLSHQPLKSKIQIEYSNIIIRNSSKTQTPTAKWLPWDTRKISITAASTTITSCRVCRQICKMTQQEQPSSRPCHITLTRWQTTNPSQPNKSSTSHNNSTTSFFQLPQGPRRSSQPPNNSSVDRLSMRPAALMNFYSRTSLTRSHRIGARSRATRR